jgi:hypothetical protein
VPSQTHIRQGSLEDTFTRLLRLGQVATGHSLGPVVGRTRLMEESEQALQRAATSGSPQLQVVAARILNFPETFRRWESEHLQLMNRIAQQPHLGRQASTALAAAFSLVHAKSLFDYLRISGARQPQRRRLIAHFYGDNGFAKALLTEHGRYLRSAASLLCLKHVGNHLIGHTAFGSPMDEYEQLYSEYFRCYCQWAVPGDADQDIEALNALQQELKADVLAMRLRLRALPLRPKLKR